MSIDLKKDRWFIRVNSVEESITVQEWLFGQGVKWCTGENYPLEKSGDVKILTNYWSGDIINRMGFMFNSTLDGYSDDSGYEIKITFKQKLEVSGVVYPKKETPHQVKIRELEETINKAQEQIKQIKDVGEV